MLGWQGKRWLKVISAALILTFLSYDIGWANDFSSISGKQSASRSLFKNKKINYETIKTQNEFNLNNIKDALSHKNTLSNIDNASKRKDLSNALNASYIKDIADIYIPDTLGKVIDSYSSPKPKATIIHIQDLHTNAEAGINLAGILEILLKDYSLGLVCSEGASGMVDTSPVSSFPEAGVKEKVAKAFINSGELTGEEYLSITKYPDLAIWGIEDKDMYFQNIVEFNKIMKFNPNASIFINQTKEALDELKPKIYSKELLDLDSKEIEYEESEVDTNKYLDYLLGLTKDINLANYKNISIFKESLEAEKTIDQSKIIKESQDILLDLQSILKEKDDKNESGIFSTKAALFKDKKISPYSFYSYLDGLARRYMKEGMDKYPDLAQFTDYLIKMNSLDSTRLFQEIEGLTYEIKDKLSADNSQKLLTKSLRHIKLLENLFNLKIANEELDYYLANKKDFTATWFKKSIDEIVKDKFLFDGNQAFSGLPSIDCNPGLMDSYLQELENFYGIAHRRDLAMFNNAIDEIEKRNVKVSALITGGFHTQGITNLLKEKGYSYVVISPCSKTGVDEGNYRDLLSGKRRPLSRLLIGFNNKLRLLMGFASKGFIDDSNRRILPILEELGISVSETHSISDRFIAALTAVGLQISGNNIEYIFTAEFKSHLETDIVIKYAEGNIYIRYKEQYVAVRENEAIEVSSADIFNGLDASRTLRIAKEEKALPVERRGNDINSALSAATVRNILKRPNNYAPNPPLLYGRGRNIVSSLLGKWNLLFSALTGTFFNSAAITLIIPIITVGFLALSHVFPFLLPIARMSWDVIPPLRDLQSALLIADGFLFLKFVWYFLNMNITHRKEKAFIYSEPLTERDRIAFWNEHREWFMTTFERYASYKKEGILSEKGRAVWESVRGHEEYDAATFDGFFLLTRYFLSVPNMTRKEIIDNFPQEYFYELDVSKVTKVKGMPIRVHFDFVEGCPHMCAFCPTQKHASMEAMPYPLIVMLSKQLNSGLFWTIPYEFNYSPLFYCDPSGLLYRDIMKLFPWVRMPTGMQDLSVAGYFDKGPLKSILDANLKALEELDYVIVRISVHPSDVHYFEWSNYWPEMQVEYDKLTYEEKIEAGFSGDRDADILFPDSRARWIASKYIKLYGDLLNRIPKNVDVRTTFYDMPDSTLIDEDRANEWAEINSRLRVFFKQRHVRPATPPQLSHIIQSTRAFVPAIGAKIKSLGDIWNIAKALSFIKAPSIVYSGSEFYLQVTPDFEKRDNFQDSFYSNIDENYEFVLPKSVRTVYQTLIDNLSPDERNNEDVQRLKDFIDEAFEGRNLFLEGITASFSITSPLFKIITKRSKKVNARDFYMLCVASGFDVVYFSKDMQSDFLLSQVRKEGRVPEYRRIPLGRVLTEKKEKAVVPDLNDPVLHRPHLEISLPCLTSL